MYRSKKVRTRSALALLSVLTLMTAACGSDDEESDSTTAGGTETTAGSATTAESADTTADAGTATTAGDTDSTSAGDTDSTSAGESTGTAGCPAIDTSVEEESGEGAGRFLSDMQCALDKPLKAEGDAITIGFQNHEGDPNGSFPEASVAAEAAVEFINNELGGLGADIQNGVPGRPIKLEVCKMAVSPDDSQRCANELSAKEPDMVISGYNFFGNHYPIYAQADVPVILGPPITVADYTTPDLYSIGTGGGCLGAHTALVYYATHQLEGRRIAVPWADTPPGVVCYYDLEAKPLDVLAGKVKGSSDEAGSMPDLTYLGVPIKPATPDLTAQVTQILDFDPDAIIFSGQAADCWNLVAGLGRSGWTPEKIPLVLSAACTDFEAMTDAGDLAKGIFMLGGGGTLNNDPDTIESDLDKVEADVYQTKSVQYGLTDADVSKAQASMTFSSFMSAWERASNLAVAGEEVTGQSIHDAFGTTENTHTFGSTPLSCASAAAPYTAVCSADNTIVQWDGTKLIPIEGRFSAAQLIAGTEIKPGP